MKESYERSRQTGSHSLRKTKIQKLWERKTKKSCKKMRERKIKFFSSVNLVTSFSVKTFCILLGKSEAPKILKSCFNMDKFDLLVLVRNPRLQPCTWNSGKVFKELPQLLRLNYFLNPEPWSKNILLTSAEQIGVYT